MSTTDIVVSVFNSLVLALIGLGALWIAIDDKFKTGFTITLGYGMFGLGAVIESVWVFNGIAPFEIDNMSRVWALMNAGIVIIFAGYLMRMSRCSGKLRRRSDFVPLDEQDQRHVSGGKKG